MNSNEPQPNSTHRASKAPWDVAIIGGGVIGLSLAWECLRRQRRVILIDRDSIGRGTSWAAAGILPPANFDRATDPIDRLRGYSHAVWPLWCQQLQSATGIDPGFRESGGLYLAATPGEAAVMSGMVAYWNEMNIDCQRWSDAQAIKRFPFLSSFLSARSNQRDGRAWWTNDEFQIRPPRLLAALAAACACAGGEMLPHHQVDCIDDTSDAVQFQVTNQDGQSQNWTTKQLVLCGGAATGWIDDSYGMQQSIIPIRGQMLLLHDREKSFDGIINLGNQYILGRGDGHVLVGSCEEEAGFEWSTSDDVIDGLHQFATQLNPALAGARRLQRWSGLRPMTFDGFPMLGTLPGKPRIHVAAGHYRSGISLAPGTAIAMADHLEQRGTFMSLEPFDVSKQITHNDPTS